MTNEIVSADPVTRMAKFQTFRAGEYWRATETCCDDIVPEGTVLLIESIRRVDNAAHTVILRAHPSIYGKSVSIKRTSEDGRSYVQYVTVKEHRLLVDEFLDKFTFEPDYEKIREAEIAAIQGDVSELQNELIQTQGDPRRFDEMIRLDIIREDEDNQKKSTTGEVGGSLVSTRNSVADVVGMTHSSVADVVGIGITEEGVKALRVSAEHEHRVATKKSKWILSKTSEISERLQSMTPFYEEKAAAALAASNDVREHVSKLLDGIGSLDLFLGKNVVTNLIRDGQSAPSAIPLTFVQKKLAVDEELSVHLDVDEWFDFRSIELFDKALSKYPALVDQIFPTERCVLVMYATRREIDYGEAFYNQAANEKNQSCWLMARDGEKIWRIHSPVETHLRTSRLFPSRDDQNNIFKGYDGRDIKFEDVAFTDRLRQHDSFALHYKRFLLLIAGLDHREKTFGNFHEDSGDLGFLSMEFQNRYCHFIYDDDKSSLLGQEIPPLEEWIADKNSHLRSGARVLCQWHLLMTKDTAPSAFSRSSYNNREDGYSQTYSPKDTYGVAIARRVADKIVVEVDVTGYSYSSNSDRTFKCRVDLTEFSRKSTALGFLVLDTIDPADLSLFIGNRFARRDHLHFMRMFKMARKIISDDRTKESATRGMLKKAITENAVVNTAKADDFIDRAIVQWRASNRGAELPDLSASMDKSIWKVLLDQIYHLANSEKIDPNDVAAYVESMGRKPLRFGISGKSQFFVYATPLAEEIDDRVLPFSWVIRIAFEQGKSKFVEKSRRWIVLPDRDASETAMHEWDDASAWVNKETIFSSPVEKKDCFDLFDENVGRLGTFSKTMTPALWDFYFDEWHEKRVEATSNHMVRDPSCTIPIGIRKISTPVRGTTENRYYCVCVLAPKAHVILHDLAPDEDRRAKIAKKFVSFYANKDYAQKRWSSDIDPMERRWTMTVIELKELSRGTSVFGYETINDRGIDKTGEIYSLDRQFETWSSEKSPYANETKSHVLATALVDESGNTVFDDTMNIEAPKDLHIHTVFRFSVTIKDKEIDKKYLSWFDIVPSSKIEGSIIGSGSDDMNRYVESHSDLFGKIGSTSRTTWTAKTFDRAVASVKNLATGKIIDAREIPEAPQPPIGATRYYMSE